MNWHRSWVVARKDLAEIRTSRWFLVSLISVPVVIALVVPFATITPLASSGISFRNTPLALPLHLTANVTNKILSDATVSNATVASSELTNSTVIGSSLRDTTLVQVFVVDSLLENVTLKGCVVRHSNLYNSSFDRQTILSGSVVVGANSPSRVILNQLLTYFLFFFVLIPVMVPTTMASYTVVGEKVNRSLEPLLASPISETELLFGKTVAILIPSLAATWAAFGLFTLLVTNQLTALVGSSPVPDATWYLTIFLVAPIVCILSIAFNLLISSRVSDVRLSQQLGGLVVLPLLVVFLGGALGYFVVGPGLVIGFAIVLALADIGLLWAAAQVFRRDDILVRWR